MTDPTAVEIYQQRSGEYRWYINFTRPMPSQGGRAPTYDAAVTAVARMVEAMRVDPDATVRESLT